MFLVAPPLVLGNQKTLALIGWNYSMKTEIAFL